MLPPKNN
jgi:hypothetical protein